MPIWEFVSFAWNLQYASPVNGDNFGKRELKPILESEDAEIVRKVILEKTRFGDLAGAFGCGGWI